MVKLDYFTSSFGRKINFLKFGDNEGPVATFVATLVIALDIAGLVSTFIPIHAGFPRYSRAIHPRVEVELARGEHNSITDETIKYFFKLHSET